MSGLDSDHGREGTAFHEAGHAVVAYRLGHSVGGASIESQVQGTLGHSASDVLPKRLKEITDWRREELTDAEWQAAWDDVLIYLAGASAEAKFAGDGYAPDPEFARSSDEEQVFGRLRRMYGDYETENERLQAAVAEARGLVDEYWTDIHVLADALMQRRTMTAEETVAAIEAGRRNAS